MRSESWYKIKIEKMWRCIFKCSNLFYWNNTKEKAKIWKKELKGKGGGKKEKIINSKLAYLDLDLSRSLYGPNQWKEKWVNFLQEYPMSFITQFQVKQVRQSWMWLYLGLPWNDSDTVFTTLKLLVSYERSDMNSNLHTAILIFPSRFHYNRGRL